MPAQSFKIDLRGKSLDEVMQQLKKNGFSVSSTKVSMWSKPSAPTTHVVWIEESESHLLTVVALNARIVTLEPGMNLHVSDRPSCCFPGQDWFVARTLEAVA